MKVLLIDDNTEITTVFQKLLKYRSIDVTVSNDGRSGLELIKNHKFDAIILDLSMPGFSGMDVIEDLDKSGLLRQNKVIVLTAVSMTDEEFEKFTKLGVKLCLRKPININQLIQTMQSLVAE